ncbi:MAG: hypothetical protein KGL04_11055 [Elusimicrobia bacterium]|nr:hypothetical protein [Elusimicrobiota bacterium]MDE2314698.1 hypothetical protein [Elusimicrobiota bacterium]
MLKKMSAAFFVCAIIGFVGGVFYLRKKYAAAPIMMIPVRTYTTFQYPEDPARHSSRFGFYDARRLKLVTKDGVHFNFIFKPENGRTARVVFKNVDVRLLSTTLPAWTKSDPALQRIALTDREWNRQEVSFNPHGSHFEISGGDGWEKEHIYAAHLARNCLNAGLWEVLLFDKENGRKTLYYHGWFTFPLGWYRKLFERETGLAYWRHWYYLEHWDNPAGLKMDLSKLRRMLAQYPVEASFNPNEPILREGEQIDKRKNISVETLSAWGDILRKSPSIRYAAFLPPGRYFVSHPWGNEYWRLAKFEGAVWRRIISPAGPKPLDELELQFKSTKGALSRYIISGFSLSALPRLKLEDYPKGLYMPMGIGVPPFHQSYEDLEKNPPQKTPYFCLWLDSRGRWINHHEGGIDGPVLLRDKDNPDLLHVFLLSYERHTLIGHYVIHLGHHAKLGGAR